MSTVEVDINKLNYDFLKYCLNKLKEAYKPRKGELIYKEYKLLLEYISEILLIIKREPNVFTLIKNHKKNSELYPFSVRYFLMRYYSIQMVFSSLRSYTTSEDFKRLYLFVQNILMLTFVDIADDIPLNYKSIISNVKSNIISQYF